MEKSSLVLSLDLDNSISHLYTVFRKIPSLTYTHYFGNFSYQNKNNEYSIVSLGIVINLENIAAIKVLKRANFLIVQNMYFHLDNSIYLTLPNSYILFWIEISVIKVKAMILRDFSLCNTINLRSIIAIKKINSNIMYKFNTVPGSFVNETLEQEDEI